MRIVKQVEAKIREVKKEGIRPSLLILNRGAERQLYTGEDCKNGIVTIKTKTMSVEEFFMDNYQLEVLFTDKQTEPDVTGKYRLEI